MENLNTTNLKIPSMKSDPSQKKYFCPHCDRFLFKGNVQKLNMVCHHCQKFISADENELMKSDIS